MKRDLYQKLLEWKNSGRRKPLIIRGARQTGKTYLLKEFARNEYQQVFYLNFEEQASLKDLFRRDLDPFRIIKELSLLWRKEIRPGKDIIIFDEIQASNEALNSLKYFREKANQYHVAAAGSLLGVKMSVPKSFPVGNVNLVDLYPMTFPEFLDALGEEGYRRLLENMTGLEPLSLPFHEALTDLLRAYYFVGGMPEAVKYYARNRDMEEVRTIQREILDTYVLDFAKHAAPADIPRLSLIWDSIPFQLARENKKFIFSAVKKAARAREYETALTWLEDAGLILRAFSVSTPGHPLKSCADRGIFKVYALDVGLLCAMSEVPPAVPERDGSLFSGYRGAFVENYAAQQLRTSHGMGLYYWRSEGKMAELDFLCTVDGQIHPLEVKAGINPRSKSLRSYDTQFQPPLLLRTTLLNLKQDGKICNIPLYALSSLPRILELALKQHRMC